MNLDDFLDHFNLIDRAQGILWGLTSWLPRRKSHKGRKVGALRIDGGTTEIRINRLTNTGGEAERILAAAHIPIAGRRIRAKEAIFVVRTRQAAWAELLLLRAGVHMSEHHQMIDPANVKYAAGKGAIPIWGTEQRARLEAETQKQPEPVQRTAQTAKRQPGRAKKRGRAGLRERLEEWL